MTIHNVLKCLTSAHETCIAKLFNIIWSHITTVMVCTHRQRPIKIACIELYGSVHTASRLMPLGTEANLLASISVPASVNVSNFLSIYDQILLKVTQKKITYHGRLC